jgi:non-reducing end alpha-L-arabinofuranosidase
MMISRRYVIPFAASMLPLAASFGSFACSDTGATDGTGGTGVIPGAAGTTPGASGSGTAGTTPAGGSGTGGSGTAGTPPAGGTGTAGSAPQGGSAPTGGGGSGTGGGATAGAGGSGGAAGGSGGAAGGGGSGGMTGSNAEGPCDVYKKAGHECVAAYSTIRRLYSTYTGPLYQVRTGSSATNTGSGGTLHDIPMKADGYADAAAQDAVCANTFCTVSKLYDQSGRENHIGRAPKGRPGNGDRTGEDCYESKADGGKITVGGRTVYSLFMEKFQGYRGLKVGNGMPVKQEPQGIYMLADGTRVGDACCWDFGNVTPTPTEYHEMNTLFFGKAYWGRGAGTGPWFGADFEAGVWMGGSKSGDPGWGGLDDAKNAPANMNNPTLRVKYALGFLKTNENYSLAMADLLTASTLTRAYEGKFPKSVRSNEGAVVLGVGGDNSNNSFGTFYEGAIVKGYPTAATEQAVMENVKAAGYGK